jgi:rhamnulokinase
VTRQYLAFDLGAESGRAIAVTLGENGALAVREVCRFANEPLREHGALRWDALRLWGDITRTLDRTGQMRFDSVGVDAWGVDYALLDERGTLLENPYHYRDLRNEGMMEEVFARVSRDRIYGITGIQFLQINTLFQLYAASRQSPKIIEAAQSLVTIPDLFNYWLTGELVCEYTNATTTQMVDACTRRWATGLVEEVGLPARLLRPIVEPGSVIGAIRPSAASALAGTPVVAPACHDTASAVAAVALNGHTAFLSSGTWSLLGTEVAAPIMSAKARDLNFTNEGGVGGTIRLLKNVNGLWLLQACRRAWGAQSASEPYDELLAAAADSRLAFRSLIDPDHATFLNPADMPAAIVAYCRQIGQPEPESHAAFTRTILESLAMKYRLVLDWLEELTRQPITGLRVVGGGSRNRLLNQLTADATGRVVLTGPSEATALGNVAMQMVATNAVASLTEARAIVERSFPAERFEPAATERWEAPYRRFLDYVEFSCA